MRVGLTFTNYDLNMADINFSHLQKLKYLKIKAKNIGHLPKLVLGYFYVVISLPLKNNILPKIK